MLVLDCKVMPYPWGSKTSIAELLGRPPSGGPEAELWMGAHPVNPSRSGDESLEAIIAADPKAALGQPSLDAFGPRLPFLLKVLAAAEPLSLQAHPTMDQARAGFADEEARGIPLAAPHRNYKDPSHKPELLCALTPFTALSGFRPVDETIRFFDSLAVPELAPFLAPLRSRDIAESFRRIMTSRDVPLVDAVVDACRQPGPFANERRWAVRFAELYPGDVGVVSALLLQLVELAPGEAIYLGAGNLHAYLEGTGMEIMASSDNVLRGGLTRKHVDVPELLRVLDFSAPPPSVVLAEPVRGLEAEVVYQTPTKEFLLSRIAVKDECSREVSGPEILFVADGSFTELGRGCSGFVPASDGHWSLHGSGTVFRATTNLS